MSRPNPQACRRLKTAIAEETGNIQGMSERRLAESNDYLVNRIPQGNFDTSAGENPRKVRYSTAPVPDSEYVDLLTQGHSTQSDRTRGCDGDEAFLDGKFDKRGAFGCNLPGNSITGGYDEFTRILRGKAWETEPFCAMDLLLKSHTNEYIAMLREDLPFRAREGFEYSLQRNVIQTGHYNSSVVAGFTHKKGAFPAIPQGVLDVGAIRRQFQLLEAQGWTGAREFGPISHEAFYTMRHNYQKQFGTELEVTSLDSNTTHYVQPEMSKVMWAGITWVLTNKPLRGYLKKQTDGSYELVPVRPTKARLGTGEGIVTDVNEDYFNCRYVCDGEAHELYEVGFAVHPSAATREGFAMPQIGGKQWENQLFNFQVNLVDGAYLDCNEDNFKGKFRLLHAYAFESLWPERMAAMIFRVSPDCVNIVAPCCDSECPTAHDPVEIASPGLPRGNDCQDADCEDCAPYDEAANQQMLVAPTETEPCPANGAGIVGLSAGGTIYAVPGETLVVKALRFGGDSGAASVDAATADGTGTAGADYTAVNLSAGTAITWADGINAPYRIEIAIPADATPGTTFTLTLSNASGATLANGTNGFATVTVEIEDCDGAYGQA